MTPLGAVWTFAVGSPATVEAVAKVLQGEVKGATIIPALGFYEFQRENSVLVKVAGLNTVEAIALARVLRREFKQESVYLENAGQAWLEYGHDESHIPSVVHTTH